MKVFESASYLEIDVVQTIVLGTVVDPRVVLFESVVADFYDTTIHQLSNWQHDTEAKKMLCFLLQHHCHYSICSIAKKYRIDSKFLRNSIRNIYIGCLQDPCKKALVDGFIVSIGLNSVKAS